MWSKIKSIHPGWVIAAFFAVLVVTNVIFFVVAASTEVTLVDRDGQPRQTAAPASAPAPPAAAPSATKGAASEP
ncbi:MAG: hypothetical protein CSA66_07080 [Proteobacteria bacterium]|nr:MAG: hypothetical protein CSA66_07080 [Pseudomonadota bacterium]